MRKHIKENWKIYLWILFTVLLVFSPYMILNRGILMQYGDPFELNFKLWQGGWRAVHNGKFGQFTWSLGLGANMFSYAFYFLTSPFFWLSCLLPEEFIPYSFLTFQICTVWFGYILTENWLYKCYKHREASVIGAFAISFSAYMFFYLQIEQLEKLFIFYPLVLYFTECFIQERKWRGLILSVGLTGLSNYYILYMFIPFLSVYTVVRYITVHKEESAKQILMAALHFAECMFIGVGISAVVLVPCAFLILKMPRFGTAGTAMAEILDLKQMYRIFTSLFIPAFDKLDGNPYIDANLVKLYGWCGGCPLFTSILTPMSLPVISGMKDKRERNGLLMIGAVLLLFLFFPYISYLFQLSIDTRWYYMFVFWNGMIIAGAVRELINERAMQKRMSFGLYVSGLIILACLVWSLFRGYNGRRLLAYAGIVEMILLGIGWLYRGWFRSGMPFRCMSVFLTAEAVFCGCLYRGFNAPVSWEVMQNPAVSADVGRNIDAIENESFYRVMYNTWQLPLGTAEDGTINLISLMSGNEPFANSYAGFGFYESVYNTNQEEFLDRLKSTWNMTQYVGRFRTYNMLSAKYWYTYDHSQPVPYGYKWREDNPAGYSLYENKNYVEFGWAYDRTINADYVRGLSYLEQDRIMAEYLVTEDSDNTEYELHDNIVTLAYLPDDVVRVYDFDKPVNNVNMYIENYGLPRAVITLYLGDEQVAQYDIWQFHYIDWPVYKPIDRVVIEAEALYTDQTQIWMHMEPFDSGYDEQWQKTTADHFVNVVNRTDHISADITVRDHDKMVFTSVPYDTGWTVTVDGTPVSYEKVQFGFIGFALPEGEHHVEFSYRAPGLRAGLAITGLSLTAFAAAVVITRRKADKN